MLQNARPRVREFELLRAHASWEACEEHRVIFPPIDHATAASEVRVTKVHARVGFELQCCKGHSCTAWTSATALQRWTLNLEAHFEVCRGVERSADDTPQVQYSVARIEV